MRCLCREVVVYSGVHHPLCAGAGGQTGHLEGGCTRRYTTSSTFWAHLPWTPGLVGGRSPGVGGHGCLGPQGRSVLGWLPRSDCVSKTGALAPLAGAR